MKMRQKYKFRDTKLSNLINILIQIIGDRSIDKIKLLTGENKNRLDIVR